ncbi:MAG: CYTH domain-containing protein [Sphingobacteriales bacterium]
MGVEIERKFLIDQEKWNAIAKPGGIAYRQGYILSDKEHTVRVRVSDKKGFLNLKSKSSNMSRDEYEYEIPLQDGLEILRAFTTNGTEKIRYNIPFEGKLWEVDEFLGDNMGLIVAEIELQREDEQFVKPDWVTTEVTDDGRYTNAALAKCPFKDW